MRVLKTSRHPSTRRMIATGRNRPSHPKASKHMSEENLLNDWDPMMTDNQPATASFSGVNLFYSQYHELRLGQRHFQLAELDESGMSFTMHCIRHKGFAVPLHYTPQRNHF